MYKNFSGKKSIVYDRDITGLGGGDREALAFAKMFQDYGFESHIITNVGPVPSELEIAKAFGDEFGGLKISHVEASEMESYLATLKPDIFFNQSYMSYYPNSSPVGIYRQMFPVQKLWKENSPAAVEAINTYSIILNNSSYTKRYTDLHWDYPSEKSHVLLPPLAEASVKKAEQFIQKPPKKEKLFVCIGRITQTKNQKVIISAFLEARKKFPILNDWKLKLIGNRVEDEESSEYYRACKALVDGVAECVDIETNVSYARLEEVLTRAFCYVHGTGAFHLPGDEPQACEHFGLSIAEGMAHGCIPLVYARGGIFDILNIEQAGIPYITFDGLLEGFVEIAELWGSKLTALMQENIMKSALKIRYERCRELLLRTLNRETS